VSKQGRKAGSVAGSAAGWYVGATSGAEAGSIGGPIGSAIGSVIGAIVGGLFGSSGRGLTSNQRRRFVAAGGTITRGGYFIGAERIGTGAARRIAQGAAVGSVVQFPKRPGGKKQPAPPPPPPPRQPGAVATGVGVGAGATLAGAILQSLPPAVQWVWNEAQQRWEMRGKDLRKGPARRYRRKSREELISENLRRQIAEIRRRQAQQGGAWTGRVVPTNVGGVRVIAPTAEQLATITAPLEEIKVTAKRLPVPRIPPLPAGYRVYKAATAAIGLPGAAKYYAQVRRLAPLALLTARNLLAPSKKPKRGRQIQQQLTALQAQGLGYSPTFSSYAAIAPQPLAQPAAKRGRCKPCPKPKKRGPRKPRSVCYRGTYTERRTGLSKSRREQIPCR